MLGLVLADKDMVVNQNIALRLIDLSLGRGGR